MKKNLKLLMVGLLVLPCLLLLIACNGIGDMELNCTSCGIGDIELNCCERTLSPVIPNGTYELTSRSVNGVDIGLPGTLPTIVIEANTIRLSASGLFLYTVDTVGRLTLYGEGWDEYLNRPGVHPSIIVYSNGKITWSMVSYYGGVPAPDSSVFIYEIVVS